MEGELTNTMTQWADKIGHLKLPIIRIAANREPEKLIMIIL